MTPRSSNDVSRLPNYFRARAFWLFFSRLEPIAKEINAPISDKEFVVVNLIKRRGEGKGFLDVRHLASTNRHLDRKFNSSNAEFLGE